MKEDAKVWFDYAEENYSAAALLLKSDLYNACLQNIQQAIEKHLKSLLLEKGVKIEKTHHIQALVNQLNSLGYQLNILPEDVELIDSIYLPSKYPFGSALLYFIPDKAICGRCMEIASKVRDDVQSEISNP